jgi:outer membrane lipoprotein-sorting protein
MSRRRSLLAWCVPAGVVLSVAAIAAVPNLMPASADAVPNLPQITPAQLLVKARTANVSTFSGNVKLSANLGLPDLSSLGSFGPSSTGSVLDYLSGTHTAQVWVDGPEHVRVAVASQAAESDWIRNGKDLWAWDSRAQTVTHTTVAVGQPSLPGREEPDVSLTPTQFAQKVLNEIDPSTAVSVTTPGYVAGRPVYELVLQPRSTKSTIASVTLAVDAATGAALDAKVTARGATSPALELGFTSISFDKPSASTFAFTPPPGVTVTQASGPGDVLGVNGEPGAHRRIMRRAPSNEPSLPTAPSASSEKITTVGQNWDTVAVISGLPLNGEVQAVLRNAKAVNGPAGSGRLISTALLNVLVLDDGRIAVGAVSPDALQAAVPPR